MKTNLETLIAASTPGELKTFDHHSGLSVYLLDSNRSLVASTCGTSVDVDKANARRLALSWNRFPQSVELLKAIVYPTECASLESGARCCRVHCPTCDARALLAQIEKEASL